MISKKVLLVFTVSLLALHTIAQDVNLDSLLDAEMDKKNKSETRFTEGSFKSGRFINGHTVETMQKGVLDFKISHRFGVISNGVYDMFGFDEALPIRIGVDYGITNRLTIGGGRSPFASGTKQWDAFLKYRLLWQSSGKTNMPVSLTLLSSAIMQTTTTKVENKYEYPSEFSYAFQALFARKFNSSFSMQLMPTMIINNTSLKTDVPSALYSLGVGARFKLTKRSGIIAEYYHQLANHKIPATYDPFSLGYEIETGGHVFQLIISNSTGITEPKAITETYNKWSLDHLHLGFNVSRVFSIKKSKDIAQFTNSQPLPFYDSASTGKNTDPVKYTQATFTTSRLINGHTVETTQKGVLDLKVTHRFGTLDSKFYNMFGLDEASMRIGADFGITDRFTIGAGRSAGGEVNMATLNKKSLKEYDGFLKYKLLRQSTGEKNMPLTVTFLSSAMYNSLREVRKIGVTDPSTGSLFPDSSQDVKIHTSDRFHYAFEILLARKFSDALSLQLMPTMVYYNIVENSSTHNALFSVGAGVRIKLTKRSNLNLEYYYQLEGHKLPDTHNSFAIGYELETGGHVFQLQLTNSYGTTERTFINETSDTWANGNIHFGFNIARVFTIVKPKNTLQ